MRTFYLCFLLATVTFVALGCADEVAEYQPGEAIVYFNSFETDEETEGIPSEMLSDQAPKGGGGQSLVITGGCIVPHLELEIGPFAAEVAVTMSCWGKTNRGLSGALMLRTDAASLALEIDSEDWRKFQTDTSLVIPAATPATLSFISGGFIPVTTYYDRIEVRIVE